MDGKPAPEAVLGMLSCDCKRKCVPNGCVCIANGCTGMCKLSSCENRNTEDTDEDELESDSEIDEEDGSCDL